MLLSASNTFFFWNGSHMDEVTASIKIPQSPFPIIMEHWNTFFAIWLLIFREQNVRRWLGGTPVFPSYSSWESAAKAESGFISQFTQKQEEWWERTAYSLEPYFHRKADAACPWSQWSDKHKLMRWAAIALNLRSRWLAIQDLVLSHTFSVTQGSPG